MERYRILSIDGGGVRGVYAAALLERAQSELSDCLERVDLVAGTSTGGLIAISLAYGMSPADIVRLFIENGKGIFTGSLLGSIRLNGLVGPEYRRHYMADLLERTFGDTRLGELERHVLIPSFSLDSEGPQGVSRVAPDRDGAASVGDCPGDAGDMPAPGGDSAACAGPVTGLPADADPCDSSTPAMPETIVVDEAALDLDMAADSVALSEAPASSAETVSADEMGTTENGNGVSADGPTRRWHPRLFHNLPGDDSSHDERLVDIALRASAAPIYFPTYQGHIDGAVVANNPSMAALAQVRTGLPGIQLDALSILSVGTGLVPTYIERDQNWGVRQWLKPLLRLMVEGSMGMVDTQCQALLGPAYHRLDPTPPVAVKLDESKRMEELVEHARRLDLNGTVEWLAEYF